MNAREQRLIEKRRAQDGQPYMGRTFSFDEWLEGYLAGRAPHGQFTFGIARGKWMGTK